MLSLFKLGHKFSLSFSLPATLYIKHDCLLSVSVCMRHNTHRKKNESKKTLPWVLSDADDHACIGL